jgi:Flp pilus assembly protein TadD
VSVALVGLYALLLVSPVARPTRAAAPDEAHFAGLSLENGVALGFTALRLGGAAGQELIGGEVSATRANVVTRLLVDEPRGLCFGYRLSVLRVPHDVQRLRVAFEPLQPSALAGLRRASIRPCLAESLLTLPPARAPSARIVTAGDTIVLDLLVKPTTNEKIVDVLQLSAKGVSSQSLYAICLQTLEADRLRREGVALLSRGASREAVHALRKAQAQRPDDAATHNWLGLALQQLGRMGEAEKAFGAATRLNPEFAAAWNNLGASYHARGRFKQAMRSYRTAIEINPDLASAHKNLATALVATGDYDKALAEYQEVYRLDPESVSVAQGAPSGAVPGDRGLENFFLAKLCAANGQIDAALGYLAKAKAGGFRDFKRVARDPDFMAVVKDDRYAALSRD